MQIDIIMDKKELYDKTKGCLLYDLSYIYNTNF